MVLPLHNTGHIVIDNALRVDWLEVCPPVSKVLVAEHDLAGPTGRLALEDNGLDDNAEPETFICGNPPYLGKGKKTEDHQADMDHIFRGRLKKWGYVDYVGCWFLLAADYCRSQDGAVALVATNSLCQGRQLPQLWPAILNRGIVIDFAHLSFKWSNSAVHNAGVTCVIVGFRQSTKLLRRQIFQDEHARIVNNINAYLLDAPTIYIESRPNTLSGQLSKMITGSVPNDGGNLLFSLEERISTITTLPETAAMFARFLGSEDFLHGLDRYCLIIGDDEIDLIRSDTNLNKRLDAIAALRSVSPKVETREILSKFPHRFQHHADMPLQSAVIVPSVSSERREWFPAGLLPANDVVSNLAFTIPDAPLWNLSLIASRLHLVWIATVCGKLKTDFRYSNTLGWNTFPVSPLTEQNKAELTACAEAILLAREAHFPATIADLYDPEAMPDDLRRAHEANDETLERIYIGRRFKNDTERLEKLFEMYTKMTAAAPKAIKGKRAA